MNDEKEVPGDDDEIDFLDELEDLLGDDDAKSSEPKPAEVDDDFVDVGSVSEATDVDISAADKPFSDEEVLVEFTDELEELANDAADEIQDFAIDDDTTSAAADDAVSDAAGVVAEDVELDASSDEAFELPVTEVWEGAVEAVDEAPVPESGESSADEPVLEAVEAIEDEPVLEAIEAVVLDEDPAEVATDKIQDTPAATVPVEPEKPFEMLESAGGQPMAVAPAVPVRKGVLYYLALVFGVLIGAVALQGVLWWAAGMDPLGLAFLAPKWALPASLQPGKVVAVMPGLPPSLPDTVDDEGSDTTESLDEDLQGVDDDTAEPGMSDLDLAADTGDMDAGDTGDAVGGGDFVANPVPAAEIRNDDFAEGSGTTVEPDSNGPNSNRMPDGLAATDDLVTNQPDEAPVEDISIDEPMSANEIADQLRDPPEVPGPADVPTLTAPSEAPINPFPSPMGAPEFKRAELAAALGASRAAADALDQARANKSPEIKKAAQHFYRTLAALAERATYTDRRESGEVVESTRELLESLRFDGMKQRMMANGTRAWIEKSMGVGVAAVANVESIEQKNGLYHVTARLADKSNTPITVVTKVDPANDPSVRFAEGDRIIFLGTIVEAPDRKIEGYRGFESRVLWMTDLLTVVP